MNFDNLHEILRSLYEEMMPLCADMAGVAKGIAGLGALFYVAYRVWQSLARAEPIDVFPMLRPFVIGLCIMFFPTVVLGTLNGVMSPIVKGTNGMLQEQTFDMKKYREQKDRLEYEAMARNPETAYLVSDEAFDKQIEELGFSPGDLATMTGMYLERGAYNLEKKVRDFFRSIMELLFEAAALIIDTLRTFFLVVLAILGPIAFAISVWDGFQSTLTQWICRYVQVYLWLPVSDLFSTILARIQILMLQNDITELQNNPAFSIDASNGVYIVFLVIGIVGYFTIPTVSGWIIQAGGMGSYNRSINNMASLAGKRAAGAAVPRALLHPLARQERHRAQRPPCPASGRQECLRLLCRFRREGVLQPHHRGRHQPDAQGGQRGVQLRCLSLPCRDLCHAAHHPPEQRHPTEPQDGVPSLECRPFGRQSKRLYYRGV